MIPRPTVSAALVAAAADTRGIIAIEHDGRSRSLPYAELLDARAAHRRRARSREGLRARRSRRARRPRGQRASSRRSSPSARPVWCRCRSCPPAQAGDVPTFARQSRHLLAASRAAAVVTTADVAPLLDLTRSQPRAARAHASMRSPPARRSTAPRAASLDADGAAAVHVRIDGGTEGRRADARQPATRTSPPSAGPHGLTCGPSDVGVSWLPLYHDMGLIGMLLTAVYSRRECRDHVAGALPEAADRRGSRRISQYRGTVSFAPNFAYELCLRRVKPSQIDALDLSQLARGGLRRRTDSRRHAAGVRRALRAGRLPRLELRAELRSGRALAGGDALRSRRLKVDVVDAGRLVRESLRRARRRTARASSVRIVGCGRPFPGHDLQIVDEDGRRAARAARRPDRRARPVGHGRLLRGSGGDAPRRCATAGCTPAISATSRTASCSSAAAPRTSSSGRAASTTRRISSRRLPTFDGIRPSGVVVFGINRVDEADEVVAVLEARASMTTDDVVDHVRRRVRETAGLELDRVVVTPPGTIPRTTSGKVRRAETRARFEAGTLLTGGREHRPMSSARQAAADRRRHRRARRRRRAVRHRRSTKCSARPRSSSTAAAR